MSQPYKISFCIVCMNRLHQLRETLRQNLLDNASYPHLEMVVLNYNSQDGMDEWIRENFSEEIRNGRMVYYHTTEPQAFSHSHSKNLAMQLATGDIVCSINADHYAGEGFASFVNEQFQTDPGIVLTTIDYYQTKKFYRPAKDVLGKVCLFKKDFLAIKGYDEQMNGYGYEDYDLVNRLEILGIRRVLMEDARWLRFIPHGEEERFSMDSLRKNLEGVYVHYMTASQSSMMIFYKDGRVEKGVVVDSNTVGSEKSENAFSRVKPRFLFTMPDPGWEVMQWKRLDQEQIHCLGRDEISETWQEVQKDDGAILYNQQGGQTWYQLRNDRSIDSILRFNYLFYNRDRMEKNVLEKKIVVNPGSYGAATVTKNFSNQIWITG